MKIKNKIMNNSKKISQNKFSLKNNFILYTI